MKADDVPAVGRSYDDPAVLDGPAARVDVCLVTMPYAAVTRPSLALGLLASALRDGGISATVAYANLWFLERVGIHPYHLCSHQFPTVMLAGEWTFAASAFPGTDLDEEHYLEIVRRAAPRVQTQGGPGDSRELVAALSSLRAEATAFVDDAARRVLATGARVVGCTSTFEQHVASLALLRRVRELDPAVVTVMGGANCEAAMGRATHRLFPWVDYVVSGEADGLIVPLCRALLARGRDVDPADLPAGVFGPRHRDRGGPAVVNGAATSDRAVFRDLDALPLPDFADYFATLVASTTGAAIRPGLPLETSRGCWWGVAHHCTFCGLNGKGMAFRSKSPDRVLAEVRDLEARHGLSGFESVDNILDAGYYRSLLPRLADDGPRRRIFFEIKSNVTRGHVEALKRAGIVWVQPGIESLHSEVLRLIDKGVQAWQNIQLLRWARELGVRLSWSLLHGFPGERDEWYTEMAGRMRWLGHLQPPGGVIRLRYDRFSVYFERAAAMGLKLRPIPAMQYVYPLPEEDLEELSYFFVDEAEWGDPPRLAGPPGVFKDRPGVAACVEAARRWREAFARGIPPVLAVDDRDTVLEVIDSRTHARAFRLELVGLERALCLLGEQATPVGRVAQAVREGYGIAATPGQLAEAVVSLEERGLILTVDGRLVSLGVRGELPRLPTRDDFPGGTVLDTRRVTAPTAPAFREA